MTFTYDLNTDVGKVRALIPDRDSATAVFSDEEIQLYLALEPSVDCAAARALEVAATDQAMALKVMRIGDESVDGVAVAKALLERAARLRERWQNPPPTADGSGEVEVIEWVTTKQSLIDRLLNQAAREGW